MNRAKRRDANEADIVAALRAAGASVMLLDGAGVPDLLVGFDCRTYLIEVKNPNTGAGAKRGGQRRKGRGALTPQQVKHFAMWQGAPFAEVVSIDEALRAIGVSS